MENVPKIIIEGSNLSGKSSIVDELERRFVHSIVVTIHGYYHPRFLEQAHNADEAIKYHDTRLKSMIPLIATHSAEELLFNRFHITASAYLKLFYHIDYGFDDVEKALNEAGVYLVLTNFDDKALEKRLAERRASCKEAPWGDPEFGAMKEKRNLYRYFFEQSKVKNKILVDNSKLTAHQAVDEIEQKLF